MDVKDYFENNNQNSKEIYQKTNTIVFTILLIIYSYFEKEAVNSFREKNKSKDQKKYDTLSLIATTAVLISGILFGNTEKIVTGYYSTHTESVFSLNIAFSYWEVSK